MTGRTNIMSFESNLQKWIVNESEFVIEGRLCGVPDLNTLQKLAKGNLRDFFAYVTEHCRSRKNARKIREILAAKRDSENDFSPSVYEQPEDIACLQLEISKALERREFLYNSVSTLETTLSSTESDIQSLRSTIDIVNQKTAFLELLHNKLREDINSVQSFQTKLSSLLCKMEQISVATAKPPNDGLQYKVSFFLNELSSIIEQQLNGEVSDGSKIEFCKKVREQLSSTPFTHILQYLITVCKNSQSEMIQSLSKEVLATSNIKMNTSNKHMKALKKEFIKKNFNIKSLKKELEESKTNNQLKKDAFETELLLSQCRMEVHQRLQLLDDMLKLEKLKKSTQFFQKSLHDLKNDASIIVSENKQQSLILPDVRIRHDRFMQDFNIHRTLQLSYLSIHSMILQFAGKLQTFVHDQVFKELFSLKDYPYQIENRHKLEVATTFEVFDAKKILKVIFESPFLEDLATKSIKNTSDVLKFQNLSLVAHSLINLKKKAALSFNEDLFIFQDDSSDIDSYQKGILDHIEDIDNNLKNSHEQVLKAAMQMKTFQIATKDWKEQGAQFVPNIEHAGRSLKMWLDVLTLLPEIHI